MTDRDRLIELLDGFGDDIALCEVCHRPSEDCNGCQNELLADYLLANGVFLLPEDLRDEKDFSISAFIEAMKMYKEKDRYIKLPCKVGEKAYFVLQLDDEWYLSEETVVDFSTKGFYYSEFLDGTGAQILVPYDEIGENVFFDKLQAEAILKEREDNG